MTQTLATGKSRVQELKDRYVPVGVKGEIVAKTALQSYFLWLGKSGCGKTHFLLSNPDAFICNLDDSSVTNPDAAAEMWPRPAEGNIQWPDVVAKVAYVIAANEQGLTGAPKMVVLDSLSGAIDLARRYAAHHLASRKTSKSDNATTKPIEDFDPDDIRFQQGETVWDQTYSWICYIGNQCRRAGLGFGLTVHTDMEPIEVMDARGRPVRQDRTVVVATAKCWRRLFPAADAVLVIDKYDGMRTTGKGAMKQTTSYTRKEIVTRHGELVLKARNLQSLPPRIDVSQAGWSDFASVFDSCAVPPEK